MKLVYLCVLALGFAMPFEMDISPQEAFQRIKSIKDKHSIVLNDDNFEHETQASTGATTGDWFVYFYQPGCNACDLFSPQWGFLAKKVHKDPDLHVNVARVNIDENPELARRFRIDRLPTLLYFSGGLVYNVTAERDEGVLLDLLKEDKIKTFEAKTIGSPPSVFDRAKVIAVFVLLWVWELPFYVQVGSILVFTGVLALFLPKKLAKPKNLDKRKRE